MALPPLPFDQPNDSSQSPQNGTTAQRRERFVDLLHQLGNSLNCALLINEDLLDQTEVDKAAPLSRANDLLNEHRHLLGPFFQQHPQGQHLTNFYGQFAATLSKEHGHLRQQLEAMAEQLNEMRLMILAYRTEQDPL